MYSVDYSFCLIALWACTFWGRLMSMLAMADDQLRIDLEYITQLRELPKGESLRAVLARLDDCAKAPDLHLRLEHYLTQRSYAKALIWLDNPDCPHHP
jgi:hypothetical protein